LVLIQTCSPAGDGTVPATLEALFPAGSDWTCFRTPEETEFWNAISSNSYLADISGPVQLHHGTADESVPTEFSQILYDQLQSTGKTAELYIYEGDNHNLSNYFSAAMQRTIEFYDRYLKDSP
jgi:dipeptidyl aminopeptidase/acylaminoacyl peptidase